MLHAHRTLDSRPRQGSLAPDAESFVSCRQIHHQRTVDDLADITVVMMTRTIKQFADAYSLVEPVALDSSERGKIWKRRYSEAGYHSVFAGLLGVEGEWQEIHRWCCEHIGRDHYSWTGGTFWFENERDATLFALRWA